MKKLILGMALSLLVVGIAAAGAYAACCGQTTGRDMDQGYSIDRHPYVDTWNNRHPYDRNTDMDRSEDIYAQSNEVDNRPGTGAYRYDSNVREGLANDFGQDKARNGIGHRYIEPPY